MVEAQEVPTYLGIDEIRSVRLKKHNPCKSGPPFLPLRYHSTASSSMQVLVLYVTLVAWQVRHLNWVLGYLYKNLQIPDKATSSLSFRGVLLGTSYLKYRCVAMLCTPHIH